MSGPQNNDENQHLTFACPHCGGPLHFSADGEVSCEAGHTMKLDELAIEQTRVTARATWLAVRAIEDRLQATRWMLSDVDAYRILDESKLQEQVAEDEATARMLRRTASMMDLSAGVRFKAEQADVAGSG
jgi:uncharacterized Zn finger protein (UPF0148 family)